MPSLLFSAFSCVDVFALAVTTCRTTRRYAIRTNAEHREQSRDSIRAGGCISGRAALNGTATRHLTCELPKRNRDAGVTLPNTLNTVIQARIAVHSRLVSCANAIHKIDPNKRTPSNGSENLQTSKCKVEVRSTEGFLQLGWLRYAKSRVF